MVVQNESNIQLVPRRHINEHLVFTLLKTNSLFGMVIGSMLTDIFYNYINNLPIY